MVHYQETDSFDLRRRGEAELGFACAMRSNPVVLPAFFGNLVAGVDDPSVPSYLCDCEVVRR
jgi:hypothetical protein